MSEAKTSPGVIEITSNRAEISPHRSLIVQGETHASVEETLSGNSNYAARPQFMDELHIRLTGGSPLFEDTDILDCIEQAHDAFPETVEECNQQDVVQYVLQAIRCLRLMGTAKYNHARGRNAVDTIFQQDSLVIDSFVCGCLSQKHREMWIEKLQYFLRNYSNVDSAAESIREVSAMLKVLLDEYHDERSFENPRERKRKRPKTSLTREKTEALKQESFHAPLEIFQLLFANSPFVFAEIYAKDAMSQLVEICKNLKTNDGLTHIAINIPEECRADFRRWLDGEQSDELRQALFKDGVLADAKFTALTKRYLRSFQALDALGIEWAFVGSTTTQAIERLEEHAENIAAIAEDNTKSKTLVLDIPDLYFIREAMGKVDLTPVNGEAEIPSLPKRVARVMGNAVGIACVRILDPNNGVSFDASKQNNGEVRTICDDLDVQQSFGLLLQNSVLGKQPSNVSMVQPYNETHDALIMILDEDQAGNFQTIQPPENSDSQPTTLLLVS